MESRSAAKSYERTRPAYRRPLWIKVEMLRERLAILVAPWAVYEDIRRYHRGR